MVLESFAMSGFVKGLIFTLEVMASLFIFVIGSAALWIVILYIIDVTQTEQTIRRNYPVIGRFRYFFEHVGQFFRQYFFTMDREELPFNRAQRSWAYRAAKDISNTVAFGSSQEIKHPGHVLFVNCAFPTLGEDCATPNPLTIGPFCKQPYTTSSLFNISGMSYGAISKPAVRALSHGAKKAGCWMNTGEGGLSPYHLRGGADIVFQIGTAKNGVRDAQGRLDDDKLRRIAGHKAVKMFEIKLSQGAKPGKGGILPAEKVTEEIAEIRGITAHEDALSPNRHPEINEYADLLNMVNHIRNITGKPVGFKMVVGSPSHIDALLQEIIKRDQKEAPDFITIDGAEGGTGAAPMPLIDAVGLSLRESLPLLVNKLHEYNLRKRIHVIASGKLVNPTDVAWALCVGADFITNARGFMFALGCIQALQCNQNTCPTGITTHDPKRQRGLNPKHKSIRVANYAQNMVKEVGIIAHACGATSPRGLNRSHARIVIDNGHSVGMADFYSPTK